MKKLLILILTLALTSVLILSACAPDEPETLYDKPKLSQLSDEEVLKLLGDLELSRTYGEEDIPRIKQFAAVLENDFRHFGVYGHPFYSDVDILYAYYYNYDPDWYTQYVKNKGD